MISTSRIGKTARLAQRTLGTVDTDNAAMFRSKHRLNVPFHDFGNTMPYFNTWPHVARPFE
jgi:hypothetical protein